MRLSELKTGQSAIIVKVTGYGGFRRRILEMGFVRGKQVEVILNAPLQDPILYRVMGYEVSLRRSEARMVEVEPCEGAAAADVPTACAVCPAEACETCESCPTGGTTDHPAGRTIHVALVGNPNSGKTSLFNAISGRHEHVGNYSGVTVGAKRGHYTYKGYRFEITDLPGTYALTAYTPEERFVRGHLTDHTPDVIVNVVAASNLERNLYLTTELIDMNPRMVVALNMYDELEASGATLDYDSLGRMMGVPMVPVVARSGEGMDALLDTVIAVFENRDDRVRHIHIARGAASEDEKTDRQYGFIAGALRETYTPGQQEQVQITHSIDALVTHKLWGFPIFLFLMWLMFYCTFSLGAYPQEWIEQLVGWIGEGVSSLMSDGPLKDLLVDGVIGGVGSVIVFLPNILILYLFIAFMEDSGYLARAAFIMDKVMHRIGLHGKSFIPMIMGFGCNVPAIMATRTIESRSSRLITVLLIPFMSCSARIPVYLLLAGTFFAAYAGWVMLGLYVLGVAMAVLTAWLLRRFLFKEDETPFVMELPPYRVPTMRATWRHTWERSAQYLRKMGGLILVASMAVWFLSYYPRPVSDEAAGESERYEQSYLGRAGKACEPVFQPLGLEWKAGVAILTGLPAKEVVVSTLGVLYPAASGEEFDEADVESGALSERLVASGDFTPASTLALLVFILLYLPCLAVIVAIGAEIGWRWATVSILYNTAVAWLMAWATYHLVSWLL